MNSADDSICDSDVSDASLFVDVDDVSSLQNECGIGNCCEFAIRKMMSHWRRHFS